MTPYFSVIVDSFRAAFASRVLWIAFIAIWLLLAALAPVGFRLEYTTDFRAGDFYNGTRLKAMLAKGTVDPAAAEQPIGRLAAVLPDELSRQLKRVGEGDEVRIYLRVFADALNECLDDESWYSQEAWEDTLQFRELRELEALAEPIEPTLRRRRARLRIEAALPGVFEARSSQSVRLTYGGVDFPASFSTDRTQFLTLVNQYVLPVIIQWLMGFVLVFLGVLVTASMIPEMLQPGSLHLLLSKPVSRSLLLLSKFAGGCTFVSLCVTQLVVGLFLIAWLRLDIWNVRLLLCIPVSVFLFSVFYSVSTLAGLIWRSSILSIGVTCIFGSICLVVGVIGGLFDSLVTRPASIKHLEMVGETMIGSTRGGGLVYWDQDSRAWNEIFESNPLGADRVLPPVAVNENQLITARVRGGRFNPFGSGASDLLVMSRENGWDGEPSMRLPVSTTGLQLSGDRVVALSGSELASVSLDQVLDAVGSVTSPGTQVDRQDGASDRGSAKTGWMEKLSTMMGGATEGFESVLPKGISLDPPASLYMDSEGKFLIVYTRGRLLRFEPDQGSDRLWRQVSVRATEGEVSSRSWIAVSGELLLLAREEMPLEIYDVVTLELIASCDLPDSISPVFVEGIFDGAGFLLGTSDGLLRRVTRQHARGELSEPLGSSEVECVCVDAAKKIAYVVHHVDQVDVINLNSFELIERQTPQLSGWRLVEKYLISPARFVTPQTGELGETIEAIVSGKSAMTVLDGPSAGEVIRYKLFRPIVSCTCFTIVVLVSSCLYFSRRDF